MVTLIAHARAILRDNGVQKALGVRPDSMTDNKWEEIDEKARSTIQLSFANEVLREVISEKTAKSLRWEKLESLYLKKTLTNKLYKKQCLYSLRMIEGTSLSPHIDEFESYFMDLQNLDVIIDDEEKALL